jgi:hypothetical protein
VIEVNIVDVVVGRLRAQVIGFEKRVEGAADLAALIQAKRLPRTPAAFVLSIGEDAGEVKGITGAQRQRVSETIGVVILDKKQGEASGEEGYSKVEELRQNVRNALCGWRPAPDYELFAMRRSRLLGMNFGAVFMQIDFATSFNHSTVPTAA